MRGAAGSAAAGGSPGIGSGPAPAHHAEQWRELGRRYLLAGDAAEALWYLRRAVEDDDEQPVAWWLLGECFEQLGDALRAARCFKVASRQVMRQGMDEGEFRARVATATGRRQTLSDS